MIADSAFLLADLSSLFTFESMLVILSLILIEGLLSVDNALAIAAMASHLEEKKRKLAMNIGYAGAYGFRIIALFIASYIVNNHGLRRRSRRAFHHPQLWQDHRDDRLPRPQPEF
jgi:predicted tellurium resistance membrane protein TerC